MKYVTAPRDRDRDCTAILESGDFKYEFIPDFVKYPNEELESTVVSSGFCDQDDNVYVMMRDGASSLVKCDSDGNYIETIETGKYIQTPHFGCATPGGNLLITNAFMHCAVELTPKGEFVREFGKRGVPSDTGHDHRVWARERRYGKLIPTELSEVSTSGKWADYMAWKTIVRRGEPFNKVTSCCFNSKGQYIFGDGYGNCAVHTFDTDGTLLHSWGEPAHDLEGNYHGGPGKFFIVHAVWCDSKDRVWVADRDSNSVTVYEPNGEIAAYIDGNLGQPSGLWYDGTYMYVVGRGGYLTIFNDDFEIVANFGYFNSDLKAHGLTGNSKGDLFLFPTHATPDHQTFKLKRIK